MTSLKIDPEFRDKIPPLTEEEFNQLRDNILFDGRVKRPIVVWNGVIVDGHHRWKVIQEHPEIQFTIEEMDFPDKWAAFEWMYRNQLGRRNLTPQQKAYMIGKMYEARKKSVGGQVGNANAKNEVDKLSESFKNRRETRDGTSGEIGKDFDINGRTVRRHEHFAKGLDRAAEVDNAIKDEILTSKVKAPEDVVAAIRKMTDDEEVKAAIEEIRDTNKKREGNWANKETKSRYSKIRENAEQMGNATNETTFDDVLRLLDSIENDFLAKIGRTIESERQKLSADDRWPDAVEGYFDSVIADINELKERIIK